MGPCCLLNYCMHPKCSEAQQPFKRGEAPLAYRGEEENQRRPRVTMCKGRVGVVMILLRTTFDCTAPRSPQIRPILMGYLGFQVSFSLSFASAFSATIFHCSVPTSQNRLLQREQRLAVMGRRSKCLSHLTCRSVWSDS